jgi:hypothetical protein
MTEKPSRLDHTTTLRCRSRACAMDTVTSTHDVKNAPTIRRGARKGFDGSETWKRSDSTR